MNYSKWLLENYKFVLVSKSRIFKIIRVTQLIIYNYLIFFRVEAILLIEILKAYNKIKF
jgi:hypothetical protein